MKEGDLRAERCWRKALDESVVAEVRDHPKRYPHVGALFNKWRVEAGRYQSDAELAGMRTGRLMSYMEWAQVRPPSFDICMRLMHLYKIPRSMGLLELLEAFDRDVAEFRAKEPTIPVRYYGSNRPRMGLDMKKSQVVRISNRRKGKKREILGKDSKRKSPPKTRRKKPRRIKMPQRGE